jgi:hypothetical protein
MLAPRRAPMPPAVQVRFLERFEARPGGAEAARGRH